MSTQTLQTVDKESLRHHARPATPPVDVLENAEEVRILVDLPGVDKEGLHVRVEKDTLTIEARVAKRERAGWSPLAIESVTTAYERVFTLPESTDVDKISVELDAGLATIRLPKSERAKPRRITVK